MLLLKNANIIQFNPPKLIQGVDILIENRMIKEVGQDLNTKYNPDKILNLDGKYVSPGLVCSHNHFYSALARGILADIQPCNNFLDILKNLWWKLDRALDEESIYYSGLIGALEAVKCGTTSVIDHNASPSFITGSLSTLKKGFEKAGLRGILAYEITDKNGEKDVDEGVKESVDFSNLIDKEKTSNDSNLLIETAIGAHAPFTLSDKSLEKIKEAIEMTKRGLHIHVSEDETDAEHSKKNFGKDVLKRLDDFYLLNEKALIAHGVYLTDDDISILNERDSFLLHNPRSNMNNGVGYMKSLSKIKNVAIGTDGIGSNMFEEVKFSFFKNNDEHCKLNMNDYMKYLQNGNVILERYFDKKFGKIEKDYLADIVIYDYTPPTNLVEENLAGHFIYGFSSRDVETVIINGSIVYENRKFPKDINSIYSEARDVANKLWERMNEIK